jgi:hypothetical protein
MRSSNGFGPVTHPIRMPTNSVNSARVPCAYRTKESWKRSQISTLDNLHPLRNNSACALDHIEGNSTASLDFGSVEEGKGNVQQNNKNEPDHPP